MVNNICNISCSECNLKLWKLFRSDKNFIVYFILLLVLLIIIIFFKGIIFCLQSFWMIIIICQIPTSKVYEVNSKKCLRTCVSTFLLFFPREKLYWILDDSIDK